MPSSLASETVRAIVPYVDGCVTPRQPTEITEIAKELTVMLVKTRFAVVPQVRLLNLNLVGSDLSPQPLTTFEIIGTVFIIAGYLLVFILVPRFENTLMRHKSFNQKEVSTVPSSG